MSPIGELRFTIMFDEFDKTFGGVFPSPIGELHFSIVTIVIYNTSTMVHSFRPLSGSYISQWDLQDQTNKIKKAFPSPIGELHFSMVESKDIDIVLGFVSVPYRGATFLNQKIYC